MIKFNYKDVAKEQGWSFEAINPVCEYSSDYYYYKEVAKEITPDVVMLDIGCGSAEKAFGYYENAKKIIMLDNEVEMLKKAKENCVTKLSEKNAKKFSFELGDGTTKLNYPDETFDLVVSRHCGGNINEIFRVLKKGGVYISEDIDHTDALELKEYFKRGQGYENLKTNNIEKRKILNESFDAGFSNIELKNFYYIEYYPNKEQLKYLLTHTPILEYLDESDEKTLNSYIKDYSTEKGIKLVRRLYAFKLVK